MLNHYSRIVYKILARVKGWSVYKSTCYKKSNTSSIFIHPLTKTSIDKTSLWNLNGEFKMGFTVEGTPLTPVSNRGVLCLENNAKFETYNNVRIGPSCRIHMAKDSKLSIGENTFILHDSKILARNKIIIGRDCAISWNVTISDYDWHKIDYDERKHKLNEVVIGDHVWLCCNAIILKGVRIGTGTVVGAGSIVCSDLPEKCLAVGAPAKPIKFNINWEM